AARRRDQPLQPVTPHREGLSPCSDGARRAGGAGPRGGLRRVRQALAARRPSAQGQLKEYTRPNTAAVRRFNGRSGIEFPTAVGPIDILAIDASGDFFVFELKRARSPDHAIGQPTRYMPSRWGCCHPHPSVGWDQGADRASNDADVSLIPPIIPYGGFSPVRLKGRLSGDAFPIRPSV